jgi:hypothetical protein
VPQAAGARGLAPNLAQASVLGGPSREKPSRAGTSLPIRSNCGNIEKLEAEVWNSGKALETGRLFAPQGL